MRFGSVPLDQALGAVLAHRVETPDGPLPKGAVIGPQALARLQSAGLAEVIVARPDPGELGEDLAAARLAAALVPDPAGQGLSLFVVGLVAAWLFTAVVQSSGATIGMTFVLISGGILSSLQQVYPIVLGAHLGTTTTAIIAATHDDPRSVSVRSSLKKDRNSLDER